MPRPPLVLLLAISSAAAAEPETLFFDSESQTEHTRVALQIDANGDAYGTYEWQPQDTHGSLGSFSGKIENGVLRVVHDYSIEGSDQSEEMLLKRDGNQLLIGQAELTEGPNGRLILVNPAAVTFPTRLNLVPTHEPRPGTPERKAIMDAIRGPISAFADTAVQFTGSVRVCDSWARFSGHVSPTDPANPASESAADEMELDFVALLKQDRHHQWQVLYWGFAGDISAMEEAKMRFQAAPWPLFEWIQ